MKRFIAAVLLALVTSVGAFGLNPAVAVAAAQQKQEQKYPGPYVDGHKVTDSEAARVFLVLGGIQPAGFYKPQMDPVQINRVFGATTPQLPVEQFQASPGVLNAISAYKAWQAAKKQANTRAK